MNSQKGITLVALIITIIVLLILAIVSIRLVMNGGIIDKSKNAVDKYSEEELQEQIKLAYSDWQLGQYTGETKTAAKYIQDSLNKTYGEGTVTNVTETEGVFTVTFSDGREYSYNISTGKTEKVVKWNDNGDGTYTHSETGTKVQIGDKVNYDEGTGYTYTTDTTKGIGGSLGNSGNKDSSGKYVLEEKTYTTEDLTWRVLGVNEKGQIELISEDPIIGDVYLANEEGYLYGPSALNTMCDKLYGKGTGAESARSLNVDDVDKLAGIKTDADKKTLNSNYGSKWKYRYPTEQEDSTNRNMQFNKDTGSGYSNSWTNITSSDYQTFRMPGESTTINSTNPGYSPELTYTAHSAYAILQKVNKTATDGKSMADLLTKGTTSSNIIQWLASSCIYCGSDHALFCVFDTGNGGGLYDSYGYGNRGNRGVRPVVTLKSNIQFTGSSSEGWTIQ